MTLRSETLLRVDQAGFPHPPLHFPVLWEAEEEPIVRSGEEIVQRVAVLNVIVNCAYGMPADAASAWLADNRAGAPRDYGAICPPDLIGQGIEWQQRIHAAGYAGIVNTPTAGVYDGGFRVEIEKAGIGYAREVEMVRPSPERLLDLARHLRRALDVHRLRGDVAETGCYRCTGCDLIPHRDL